MLTWFRRTFELDSSRRLLPMEGLRGAAVLLVFFQHYTTQALTLNPPGGGTRAFALAFADYGTLGVELFFVLSGFLIYGLLVRRPAPFAPFMARRIERIYPAFLVVFVLDLALHLALPARSKLPHDFGPAALYVLANVLLLPGVLPIEPLLTVTWSLSYELLFYLAVPGLIAALGLRARPRRVRVGVIAVLALALTAAVLLRVPGALVRMLPFFAGMLVWEAMGVPRARVPSWIGLGAPVAAFVVDRAWRAGGAPSYMGLEWLHAAAFGLLCLSCFKERLAGAVFGWTPLRWLGNMSYSYYLAHGLVVKAAMETASRVLGRGSPDLWFWALLGPVFAATLVVAGALFVWVEKPISLRPRHPAGLAPAG